MHQRFSDFLCFRNANPLMKIDRQGVIGFFDFHIWTVLAGAGMHKCAKCVGIRIIGQTIAKPAKVAISCAGVVVRIDVPTITLFAY